MKLQSRLSILHVYEHLKLLVSFHFEHIHVFKADAKTQMLNVKLKIAFSG